MNNLRDKSIADGLIPPAGEAEKIIQFCPSCLKQTGPTAAELYLASLPHRWKEMRDLQKQFFMSFADQVTEMEIQILDRLGLPDIDTIRKDADQKQTGTWELTTIKENGYKDAVAEFEEDILGDNDDPADYDQGDSLPIIQYFALLAMGVGIKKNLRDIRRILPEGINPREVFPKINNEYLKAMIRDGGKRIKTQLAKKHMKKVLKQLRRMAKEGTYPLDVGRYIHKQIGEGDLWYWNRIARSEPTLANNAAFITTSQANGVKYEQWSAGPGACDICTAFSGNTWELGKGPRPVADSHPHCLCFYVPYYQPDSPVRPEWERVSPYEQRYQPDEIRNLSQIIREGLF